MRCHAVVALALAMSSTVLAQSKGGTFEEAGETLVSAMMMFIGGSNKVYILDKVEGNAHRINGHSAYASVWDIASRTAVIMDVQTNPFCAAGMHLPNGSFATFGGNSAVGPGGDNHISGSTKEFDPTYKDHDGRKAIRIITPCEGSIDGPGCDWYDAPNGLQMASQRWYPAAEALADGSVVLVGGFTSGGYINRNYPNKDPGGASSNPTYEFFPSRGGTPEVMNFMLKTSGLNAYALTYLMPSGKMFVQANYSTTLWDYNANKETALLDMPGQIVRVYPASGANTMLPLTVANNYEPTVLFCGGFYMDDEEWGDYGSPRSNPWEKHASKDCRRITPEPQNGSKPEYIQDDDLPTPRSMGQFIALPDGTFLVVNGAHNGTAGYGDHTYTTPVGSMPFGDSFATEPEGQPAIYNPNAPAGQRWSTAGLGKSQVPRLYHSSALLLPDGSVMIAGSNPNVDVNTTTIYPTTYKAEYFYPPYFNAATRPAPSGIPSALSYGGDPFDIAVPASSYSGTAKDAAGNTTVWLIRQGFTTHAMNMGQRILQLNNTYTVADNGTLTIHTAQLPPNPNLFTPGPAFVFVTIGGIPSNGTYVIVGNGRVGKQPTAPASVLPDNARSSSGDATSNGSPDNQNQPDDGVHMRRSFAGILCAAVAVPMISFFV
ncbi:glyoxal oxidase [Amylostereum chailletii]|nr:glyoxal oxidase [Amylostereum chailletii]